MLISTLAGARQISPIHCRVAGNHRASLIKIFTRVILPGSLLLVLGSVRLRLDNALLLTIPVELVVVKQGAGAMIWLAWETLRMERLYASLMAAVLLGIGFSVLLHRLTLCPVPWQTGREMPR